MLLQVTPLVIAAPSTLFRFTVPGHQRWTLRSVRAVCARAGGGAPGRAYTLIVTDGTNEVAVAGADDAGTDPGTCSVTWANTPAASVAAGSAGVVVAPIGALILPAGYTISGVIVGAVAGDHWTSAVAWYDFALAA